MDTYERLKQHLETVFLVNVLTFLKKSGTAPDNTMDDWMRAVSHMHDRGWLYYTKEDGKIVTIVGAYRIKKFDEKKVDVMPDKEEGDILFINFAASTSEHKTSLKKMLSKYVDENKNIKEIIFYPRNQDKEFKRIKVRSKDVKEKDKSAGTSKVPVSADSTA